MAYNPAKHNISDGVNRVQPKAKRPFVGTGWVILNTQVDDYQKFCVETNTISIVTNEHEPIQRCSIITTALKDIVFPTDADSLGSLVVWVNPPNTTVPIIVGVINKADEKNNLPKIDGFHFQNGDGDNGVLFEGTASTGIINLIGRSVQGAEFNVKVFNEKLLGLIDLYVQGKLTIEAEDRIIVNTDRELTITLNSFDPETELPVSAELSYAMQRGFNFIDEFGNSIITAKESVTVKTNQNSSINLIGDQNAVQKSLLGESTIQTISDILDALNKCVQEVQNLQVTTSSGPGSVLPQTTTNMANLSATITKIKGNLSNLQSKNITNS